MFDSIWTAALFGASAAILVLSLWEVWNRSGVDGVGSRLSYGFIAPLGGASLLGLVASSGPIMGTLSDVLQSKHHHNAATTSGRNPASANSNVANVTDLLQTAYADLGFGKFQYNPPDQMVLDRSETISVRVFRNAVPRLSDIPMVGHGAPRTETIKVAPKMAVELSGDNFEIRSSSPRTQFVPDGGFAEWIFHVDPQQEGDQTLVLQASVLLGDGAETELPAISRDIHVKVLTGQRFERFVAAIDLWKVLVGLLAATVTGIGGYLIKKWWESRT